MRAGKYPILVGRVRTLQPPVPQDLGQSQIEWNRLARGFRFAVAYVLHDDRANDMDHHLLKIDVAPLETEQLANSKAREHGDKNHRSCRLLQDAEKCRDLLD